MTSHLPDVMTDELARSLLAALPAEVGPGLSEVELDVAEQRYGFRFALDHRVFLRAGLPLGRGWPDWRDGDRAELRGRLDQPRDGVLFDVRHGFWYPGWGRRPDDLHEALRLAANGLAQVPQLVPVFSHRYLPGVAGQVGHPVLSVHQTDTIYYGSNLADYLRREFGLDVARSLAGARTTLPFWSYLLGGDEIDQIAEETPHDPYARHPEDAVDHLRMLAVELRIGRRVAPDTLVQAALCALVLDVDTPAVRLLAGLTRREDAQAHSLFTQVLDELDLTAQLPATDWEARWTLARWWLHLIVEGSMNPVAGVNLILYAAWNELGHPEELEPIQTLVAEQDDAGHQAESDGDNFGQRVVDQAKVILVSLKGEPRRP